MANRARELPFQVAPGWPDTPSPDPVAEVARRLVLNMTAAIGDRSVRSVAAEAGLSHVTLLKVIGGRSWPDLVTVARLEKVLGPLWPGTP